jgi:uncharacterized protein YodC (DUF2158 family)
MKTTYNLGDLVILKSGSPTMTVEGQDKDKKILCVWFNKKGEKCSDSFFTETLNKASEEEAVSIAETSNTEETSSIEEALSVEEVSSLEETKKPQKHKKHHNDEQASND